MEEDDNTKGEKGIIEPDWEKKFRTAWVREQVKSLVDSFYSEFQYSNEEVISNGEKAVQLSIKIRDALIKNGKLKRYKLNIQTYLGEKKDQKVVILAKGWWDTYVDNYVTYTYHGENFYSTSIVWGFYTD